MKLEKNNHKESTQKIPLIYILGSGRSGSTLLDLLLNAHPMIWSLGEAEFLPWEIRENRKPCGCGKAFQECDFWKAVLPNIPIGKGLYPIEHFKNPNRAGKTLRWELLPGLIQGKLPTKWQQAANEYGQLNAEFFKAVWQTAEIRRGNQIRWLVDASKDIYRLYWLHASNLFELRVIHLTKDPRAYVYAQTMRAGLEGVAGLELHQYLSKHNVKSRNNLLSVIWFSGQWLAQNGFMSRFCHQGLDIHQIYTLRYEELAVNPQQTIDNIGNWLDLSFPEDHFKKYFFNENHAVSGNPMRWRQKQIRFDERWRHEFPSLYAKTSWVITRPVGWQMGYR